MGLHAVNFLPLPRLRSRSLWGIYSTAFQGGEAIWSPLTATRHRRLREVPLYNGDTEAALSQHPGVGTVGGRDTSREHTCTHALRDPLRCPEQLWHVTSDGRWVDTKALMGAALNNFQM